MAFSYLNGPLVTELPFHTIGGSLKHFAVSKPDDDAVVFCSTTGHRVAVLWKELCEKSYKMAKAFVHLGVKPGECIAVVTRTCPEWLYVTFGAMLAGARVITIVFTYKDGSDVVKLMEKIGNCSLLVLDPGIEDSNWNIIKPLLEERCDDGRVSSAKLPYLRHLFFMQAPDNDKVMTVNEIMQQDHSAIHLPEVDQNDIGIMFQTSGSTGVPKLVAHTYASVIEIANKTRDSFFSSGRVYFNDRPFGWGGGFPFGVLIGQKRVTVSGFCPEPVDQVSFLIEVIQKEKCTLAGMFTNTIHEVNLRHKDLPSDWPLESILTGGQPITKVAAVAIGKVCKTIVVGYGGSEFGFSTALVVDDPDSYEDYANGNPLPGVEVKVVDTDGEIVPLGERGELYLRSKTVFKEYLNDPEKTAKVKTLDGWYKTDDIGRIDLNGCIFVEGRISNTIISGGMNVSPAILEAALKTFPGVQSAVVVPISDEILYQVVCACVCVASDSNITEAMLADFMERIHNDKQKLLTVLPKEYLILNRLPEEQNGKISRKKLRIMAEQKFQK